MEQFVSNVIEIADCPMRMAEKARSMEKLIDEFVGAFYRTNAPRLAIGVALVVTLPVDYLGGSLKWAKLPIVCNACEP